MCSGSQWEHSVPADGQSSRTPSVPLTCRWRGGPPASRWRVPSFPVEQHNVELHYAWISKGGDLGRRTSKTEWQDTGKNCIWEDEKRFSRCASEEAGGMVAEKVKNTETTRGVTTNTSDLAAAFCSCFILMASSFTGLGMKVMSAPSFTSRPIHQSLLYFCAIVKQTFLSMIHNTKMYW